MLTPMFIFVLDSKGINNVYFLFGINIIRPNFERKLFGDSGKIFKKVQGFSKKVRKGRKLVP